MTENIRCRYQSSDGLLDISHNGGQFIPMEAAHSVHILTCTAPVKALTLKNKTNTKCKHIMNRCTIIKSEFILTLGTKSPSSSSSSSPSSSCSWGNNKMFLSFSSNHWFNRSIYKNKYSVCKWKEQTSSSPSSSSSSSNCIKNNKITKKSQMWNNSDYKFSFCFFSSLQTFCGLCVGTCLCSNVTVVCVCVR